MKLKAISKFFWRGQEYQIGNSVECDKAKGEMFIAQGLCKANESQEPETKEQAAEIQSEPEAKPLEEAGDPAPAAASKKSKSRKKKA